MKSTTSKISKQNIQIASCNDTSAKKYNVYVDSPTSDLTLKVVDSPSFSSISEILEKPALEKSACLNEGEVLISKVFNFIGNLNLCLPTDTIANQTPLIKKTLADVEAITPEYMNRIQLSSTSIAEAFMKRKQQQVNNLSKKYKGATNIITAIQDKSGVIYGTSVQGPLSYEASEYFSNNLNQHQINLLTPLEAVSKVKNLAIPQNTYGKLYKATEAPVQAALLKEKCKDMEEDEKINEIKNIASYVGITRKVRILSAFDTDDILSYKLNVHDRIINFLVNTRRTIGIDKKIIIPRNMIDAVEAFNQGTPWQYEENVFVLDTPEKLEAFETLACTVI